MPDDRSCMTKNKHAALCNANDYHVLSHYSFPITSAFLTFAPKARLYQSAQFHII